MISPPYRLTEFRLLKLWETGTSAPLTCSTSPASPLEEESLSTNETRINECKPLPQAAPANLVAGETHFLTFS